MHSFQVFKKSLHITAGGSGFLKWFMLSSQKRTIGLRPQTFLLTDMFLLDVSLLLSLTTTNAAWSACNCILLHGNRLQFHHGLIKWKDKMHSLVASSKKNLNIFYSLKCFRMYQFWKILILIPQVRELAVFVLSQQLVYASDKQMVMRGRFGWC